MKTVFLAIIKFYQKVISPCFPARCRFYPTCSAYAATAIERFGIIRGGWMALCRILKCNPLHKGGVDFVPEKIERDR